MTTSGSPSTWLTLVREPLPFWSYWEEKLAMPTVVQQRVSVTLQGYRLRFSVTSQPQSASFREVRLQTEICGPWRNPPRSLAGGLPERICPVEAFSIVPRRVASVFVVYEGWRGLSGCRVLLLSGGMPPERTLLCPYPTTPWRIRQAPPS